MKIAQKITIGAVLLVLLVVGAGIFLFSSLDSLVEGAIETYGSEVTQTAVRVDGVKIGVTTGEGTISGLTVGNPDGFSADNIFSLGNITTVIDTATITESPVVIKLVKVSAPKVFYEIDKSGNSNLDALKKNIAAATGGGGKSSDSGEATKVIIKRLVIAGGEVEARIATLGDKPLSVALPQITITDIGKSSGGASPAEVAESVLNAIMKKTRSAVTDLDLDKYLGKSLDDVKALGSELGDKLDGDALKKGGDALKSLF